MNFKPVNENYDIYEDGSLWSHKSKGFLKPIIIGEHVRYRVDGKIQSACRLVLQAFKGPAPKGQCPRFWDGNRLNVSLSNLTYADISTLKCESRNNIKQDQIPILNKEGVIRKKIKAINKQTGEIITYDSITSLCSSMGFYRKKFYNILNSTTDHYSWSFQYITENQ